MFQSHAGSIEAIQYDFWAAILYYGFNPTLVRLRLYISFTTPLRLIGFQSHAGSIEAEPTRSSYHCYRRFQSHAGSIEAWSRSGSPPPAPSRFQSHAGSIEANMGRRVVYDDIASFNPTLVRLRPRQVVVVRSWGYGFNPTLVRLRRRRASPGSPPTCAFQSHAGSIEARRIQPFFSSGS